MNKLVEKTIHLVLVILSLLGWITFGVGFGLVYNELSPASAFLPSYIHKGGLHWQVVLTPMWLFGSSGVLLYLACLVRVFLKDGKWGHVTMSIVLFFNLFYLIGAGTTLLLGLIMLEVEQVQTFLGITSPATLKVMNSGCLIAIIAYWILLTIWPLSALRERPSEPTYQELLHNSGEI